METVFIYGLFDPRNYRLKYIGQAVSPKNRLARHILHARKGVRSYKDNWIRGLLKHGLEPSLEILEECIKDNCNDIEKVWIKDCKAIGIKLTNMTKGGNGGDTRKGAPQTEETKRKMSLSKMGNIPWNKGKSGYKNRPLSEEAKRKISERQRGKRLGEKRTEEQKRKISQTLMGRRVPDEVRKKISESHKGKSNVAWLGRKHTEEAKAKMKESRKKWKPTFDENGKFTGLERIDE